MAEARGLWALPCPKGNDNHQQTYHQYTKCNSCNIANPFYGSNGASKTEQWCLPCPSNSTVNHQLFYKKHASCGLCDMANPFDPVHAASRQQTPIAIHSSPASVPSQTQSQSQSSHRSGPSQISDPNTPQASRQTIQPKHPAQVNFASLGSKSAAAIKRAEVSRKVRDDREVRHAGSSALAPVTQPANPGARTPKGKSKLPQEKTIFLQISVYYVDHEGSEYTEPFRVHGVTTSMIVDVEFNQKLADIDPSERATYIMDYCLEALPFRKELELTDPFFVTGFDELFVPKLIDMRPFRGDDITKILRPFLKKYKTYDVFICYELDPPEPAQRPTSKAKGKGKAKPTATARQSKQSSVSVTPSTVRQVTIPVKEKTKTVGKKEQPVFKVPRSLDDPPTPTAASNDQLTSTSTSTFVAKLKAAAPVSVVKASAGANIESDEFNTDREFPSVEELMNSRFKPGSRIKEEPAPPSSRIKQEPAPHSTTTAQTSAEIIDLTTSPAAAAAVQTPPPVESPESPESSTSRLTTPPASSPSPAALSPVKAGAAFEVDTASEADTEAPSSPVKKQKLTRNIRQVAPSDRELRKRKR